MKKVLNVIRWVIAGFLGLLSVFALTSQHIGTFIFLVAIAFAVGILPHLIRKKSTPPPVAAPVQDVAAPVQDVPVPTIPDYTAAIRAKARAEWDAAIDAIPRAEVAIEAGRKQRRGTLAAMPEIKYSPVGKSFDFDRLPAYVVVDCETTGLQASTERIVALTALRIEDGEPVEAFSTLVNPGRPIPEGATAIHGITDDMVAAAPTVAEVTPAFLAFLGTMPIVGYNLPFELKFLWAEGVDFAATKRRYYDVFALAKKVFRNEYTGLRLTDVCDTYLIWRTDTHHSLSDCLATDIVFRRLVRDL